MPPDALRLESSYTRLPETFYTRLSPTPVPAPRLLLFNAGLAAELGLPELQDEPEELAALLGGNRLPAGAQPFAQAYAGHQFGHFTMLGDGRALVLGEWVSPSGARYDLQLKGSGRTPYSRGGDGRAVLGPMLREFVISEAMHALGIPTTRSLAVVTTGERVYRETALPGAILTRVARSHIRVGTFQYAAMSSSPEVLEALLDYTLWRHMPELREAENRALAFLEEVVARQARLMAEWLRVGFIHGVMNTDNMALSGETIDYGPCAFVDAYHPGQVFSSIDHRGRYAFMNQPRIAQWNLARLAETLLPLLDPVPDRAIQAATRAVDGFSARFEARWEEVMRAKLGLTGAEEQDRELFEDLLAWMQRSEADYTNTFADLGRGAKADPALEAWRARWEQRRDRNPGTREEADLRMKKANPVVIPRNHKVEQALEAATDRQDLQPFRDLLDALADPYEDRPELARFQAPPTPEERVHETFCGT